MIHRLINRFKKEWRKTPFGRVSKSSNPVRWGIIGTGYMAETFSCAIDGNKDGIVCAVASRSLEKANAFAKKHGCCRAYGSYAEMVYDDSLKLDVVYVATPVDCHFENVLFCLEAGVNVLCEKPITNSSLQLEKLIKIAQERNCFLMEGMWTKCLPAFKKACQWISDGRISNLELLKVDFYKREHINGRCKGVLFDYGVYALAMMEHFLKGYPDTFSFTNRVLSNGADTDWQIVAHKNDVQAIINISSNFGSLSKAAAIGKSGFIEWESQFNRTNCVTLYDANGIKVETFKTSYKFEGFEYEVDEVQACIRDQKKESATVNLQSTLNTMKILDSLKCISQNRV